MGALSNLLEKQEHHKAARKALAKAKAIEKKKLSDGYDYVQIDNRTWRLCKGETGKQKAG